MQSNTHLPQEKLAFRPAVDGVNKRGKYLGEIDSFGEFFIVDLRPSIIEMATNVPRVAILPGYRLAIDILEGCLYLL